MKVSFLGLGTMGYPMAGHLSKAGHEVVVYNRTISKAEAWCQEHGGSLVHSPAETASEADIIITCVGNDDDLRCLYLGEQGALSQAKAGTLFIDHTTASAGMASELYAAAKIKGCDFIDAPVSGGQSGAEQGILTIMIGGDQLLIDFAQSVLSCYSKSYVRMGGVGAGQIAKMVNQILIGGILTGLSEGVRFAQRAGLDIPTLVEVLRHGAAGSWQLENRGETMAKDEFDFGFAIEWMHKDLSMALSQANSMGVVLPHTERVSQEYLELIFAGHGRRDTSVLIKAFDKDT